MPLGHWWAVACRGRAAAHREDVGLRERTLWRMLYETAARPAEVLALNVEDLKLPNRRIRVSP